MVSKTTSAPSCPEHWMHSMAALSVVVPPMLVLVLVPPMLVLLELMLIMLVLHVLMLVPVSVLVLILLELLVLVPVPMFVLAGRSDVIHHHCIFFSFARKRNPERIAQQKAASAAEQPL